MFKANSPFVILFSISAANGAAANADALPVASISRNGVDDGATTLVVANVDVGRYKVSGTLTNSYVAGDSVSLSIAATIGGVAAKNVIVNDIVDRGIDLTQAVPNTNTAGTVGDALNAARAQGFGTWKLISNTLTLFGADGTTPVRVFTLDSATAPTQRV